MVLYRQERTALSILNTLLSLDFVTRTTSTSLTSSCCRQWRTACRPWPSPSPRTTPPGSTLSRTEDTNPTRGSGYSAILSVPSSEPIGRILLSKQVNRYEFSISRNWQVKDQCIRLSVVRTVQRISITVEEMVSLEILDIISLQLAVPQMRWGIHSIQYIF